jgi:hypothetical protein
MLAGDVSKPIDNPGGLVVSTVGIGIAGDIVGLGGKETEVGAVDKLENVLSPCDKILPSVYVIP